MYPTYKFSNYKSKIVLTELKTAFDSANKFGVLTFLALQIALFTSAKISIFSPAEC